MQADVKWCRDNGIETLTEHAVAVRPNHIMADTHTLRTVDTLVGIAQDKAVRQVQVVVMVVAWLSIMEAIIGQSVLDTIFLQVTLSSRRTGALQTPCSFSLSLLLQIA